MVHDLRRRGVLFWAGLAASLLVVAFVAGRPNRGGPPLDPASSGPLGAKGLVLLLRELGADVEVADGVTGQGGTAAVLSDTLTGDQRDDLEAWVRAGGILLLADPGSPLSQAEIGEPFGTDLLDVEEGPVLARRCAEPALAQVDELQLPAGVPLDPPAGATGCFPHRGGHLVVADPLGEGVVVTVGGGALFMNSYIGDADNAALAAAVLAPRPGARVTILRAAPVGAGQRSLSDLMGHRVKGTIWQLVIAFVFLALWRGRRLGRPVPDPQPVEVAGSELVVAVGHLLQRGHHRDRATELLAGELRRTLGDRLGLPPSAAAAVVADVAAAHTSRSPAEIVAVLTAQPATDDALVELARQTENVRQEVVHAP